MKIALVASNYVHVHKSVRKGTEIFVYLYTTKLQKIIKKKKLDIRLTAFASGDSDLPVKIESVHYLASTEDPHLTEDSPKLFELSLLSKAFSMQDKFDLFHIHIGNGEYVMPFLPFIKKPVLITMHHSSQFPFTSLYHKLYSQYKNVHFVSISEKQRTFFPHLNYIKTIYHGVNTKKRFTFDPHGGDTMLWAGRAVPEKGPDIVLEVASRTKRKAHLAAILKPEHLLWFQRKVLRRLTKISLKVPITETFDLSRSELIEYYQKSKLFINPIQWEEAFGLVMVESMACGTPVVAYARGSVPELVKDGVTGFIVNSSPDDIRGNFIIKKTGIEGLCEAVQRIYAMPKEEYEQMRQNTRQHVLDNFTDDKMIESYLALYRSLV